ncbi:MAG: hypothetical protein KBT47_08290 [Armatimonadetes bacterium]|nr:hypothetical protein [Candidatus Hippobium faecium]
MDNIIWVKGEDIGVLGRPFPNARPYCRLEDRDIELMEKVHYAGMSFHPRCSSGMHIDFETDTENLYVKWEVVHAFFRSDVPISCESCIDCYTMDGNRWRYLSTAFVDNISKKTECLLYSAGEFPNLPRGRKSFSINLPTYDFVLSLEIGVDKGSFIKGIKPKNEKPVAVYGTSITQGGHASRPGLIWPTQVRRMIGRELVNLGFSGSGRLEPEMTDILCRLDPAVMVMDCVANMRDGSLDEFTQRWIYFYKKFRETHSHTPLLIIEQPTFANDWAKFRGLEPMNRELRKLVKKWQENDRNIEYIKTNLLYTPDGEGTVDGIHGTDASFQRMSRIISRKLKDMLK